MTRTKKTILTSISREDAVAAAQSHASAANELKRIEAAIEAAANAARQKSQKRIAELQSEKQAAFEVVQQWASENRDTEFATKKSQSSGGCTFGFRMGTPKTTPKKGFTWASILSLMKERALTKYIRSKEEVDKELILSEREDESAMMLVGSCGVQVTQDEAFFIEVQEESLQ